MKKTFEQVWQNICKEVQTAQKLSVKPKRPRVNAATKPELCGITRVNKVIYC